MSKKSRACAKKDRPKELDVEPDELERVLVQECGYQNDFLKYKRVSRLRGFAALLLRKLRLDSWPAFTKLDAIVRHAALRTSDYPPPGGAVEYFKVRLLFVLRSLHPETVVCRRMIQTQHQQAKDTEAAQARVLVRAAAACLRWTPAKSRSRVRRKRRKAPQILRTRRYRVQLLQRRLAAQRLVDSR